jgi:two-component system sensor kinase FixL
MSEAAQETLRAGNIVRRLRDFVARGEVDKSMEDLPTLIEEAGQLALVGARERGVRSFFILEPQATPVLVDKVQIQQVLVNLMRNAVEAMATVPVRDLTVSSRLRSDGFVEITVADTGQESRTTFAPGSLKRSSQPRLAVWVLVCRYAERSLRLMGADMD